MRYFYLSFCILIVLVILILGITPSGVASGKKESSPLETTLFEFLDTPADKEVSLPFTQGEQFIYTVNYKSLPLGNSTLTFKGERELDGAPAYFITFVTDMPTVKDAEGIYADKETFLPLQVNRYIQKMAQFPTEIT